MSEDPDKVSRFWQELKRRKVTRVITVYAASAFVILELLSNIIEPLKLPEWTLQFARNNHSIREVPDGYTKNIIESISRKIPST